MWREVYNQKTLALVLACSIIGAMLGTLPHVVWSLERGQISWFKSGFDEDTYAERALRHEARPDRMISTAGFLIAKKALGDLSLVMIVLDVFWGFLTSFAAALLASVLARRAAIRLQLWVAMLFGFEFIAMGASVVWPVAWSPWLWFSSPLWKRLIPYNSTSFLTLFRSPEPQVAWFFLFLTLALWLGRLVPRLGRWTAYDFLIATFLPVIAVGVYAFVGFPMLLINGALAGFLLLTGHRRSAVAVLSGIGLALLTFLGLSRVDGAIAAGSVTFSSHLPSLSIGALLSLVASAFTFYFHKNRPWSWKAVLGLMFLLLPVVLMNQQVLLGRMVSTRDFEINVNFILITVGAALVFGESLEAWISKTRLRSRVLATLLAIEFILITRAQFLTYQSWRPHNDVAQSFATLYERVRSRPGLENAKLALSDHFEVSCLMRLLSDDLPKTERFLGYFNDVQDRHIANLQDPSEVPRGRDLHAERFFEYLLRLGVTPEAFAQRLKDEIEERAGFFYLAFFFSIGDSWWPHTDRRAARPDWIVSQIPNLMESYRHYIQINANRVWPKALILSTHDLEENPLGGFSLSELSQIELKSQPGTYARIYEQTTRN